MKITTAVLAASLLVGSQAMAADATFSWIPNTETDLAGYKLHYGAQDGGYGTTIDVGLISADDTGRVVFTARDVPTEPTDYTATAYDDAGNESGFATPVKHDPAPSVVKEFKEKAGTQILIIVE